MVVRVEKLLTYLKFYLRCVPPLVLIALPLYAAYAAARPWPTAAALLAGQTNSIAIAVGGGGGEACVGDEMGSAWTCRSTISRQYILLPDFLARPTIMTVTQIDTAAPTISESGTGLGLSAALTYLLCIFCTWIVWVKPKAKVSSS